MQCFITHDEEESRRQEDEREFFIELYFILKTKNPEKIEKQAIKKTAKAK